ncbi:MAG: CPBP family intramembrane metalloprotease, partial [bacterium]|nr:CPBP family intramembrane metalloprotease [bacterium]
IESAGVLIFMFAFTYFLFNLTDVHFEQNIKELGDKLLKQGIAFGVIDAYTFVFLILAGVREEIVFRLFIQRGLTKLINKKFWGPFISITLVSIVWAFGHYGTLVPGWVKILQIFIFGILLGILSRRHGIGSCILVHVMFNISTGIFNNLFIEI